MKKIKIIDEQIVISYVENKETKLLRYMDRDGNTYYKRIDSEKWTCIPPPCKTYNEGYGLSIEEAYSHLYRTFDIPDRLTN